MNNRGFTLVEVIVVMVMLGIMLAIALPSMNTWREGSQVKEVAQDMLSGLRQARSLAVMQNQSIKVTLALDTGELEFNGVSQKTFPDKIKLEAKNKVADAWLAKGDGDVSVTFTPQGACGDTFFVRVDEEPKFVISIESTATALARLP